MLGLTPFCAMTLCGETLCESFNSLLASPLEVSSVGAERVGQREVGR